MSLRSILRSGYVRRFHANPDLAHVGDTVAHHHGMVAQIVMAMHPAPSIDLIRAALHHDCGEMVVGDLPAPFKDSAPIVAAQHAAVEDEARLEMGLSWSLSHGDRHWIRFADRLAAYVHVRQVAPAVLGGDGWPEARADLSKMAIELGVIGDLDELLNGGLSDLEPDTRLVRGQFSDILSAVAKSYGIAETEIRGYSRQAPIVAARQRVMYLANQAGMSLPQIGRLLRRDHSTVKHGIDREAARVRGTLSRAQA